MNTIVMEHFNSILFHKFGPANKQHSYRLISLIGVVEIFVVLVKTVVFQTEVLHSLRKSSAVLHVGSHLILNL